MLLRMDGGIYIAVFYLPVAQDITIGQRGAYFFRSGVYLYVGSAQQHLEARIARHARQQKALRWHVDYLSTRAPMMGAIILSGRRARECEVAAELRREYELTVPGFGASDCRCGGHLFFMPEL